MANKDRFEESGGAYHAGRYSPAEASTEILTMGIERLNADPIEFYMNDPEYFKFVIQTLQHPKKWRSTIDAHWRQRTKNKNKEWDPKGKWYYIRGGWISNYAGRFYGNTGGLELPSVYLEAASWGAGRLAKI